MRPRVLVSALMVLALLAASGVQAENTGGAASAGVKAVWNFFYRTYYFGNLRAESQVNMMNPHALERRLDVDVKFLYYDGVPEEERLPDNPQNFLYQQIVLVKGPADLQGTGSLS